ncbi:probable 39S ribosomal protein L23, mitochondrial [Toxorhynchites rutilus septentrionalis]|uniref:probable 39S ribosomal protein L23, mitochondrial n=1 Tax=Toxorhynchites rutilus septentrionalis TaxID=329112 RepID=UPI002479C309|nr:probable 39S ribosomal protein L23, mitochondrial [Toxorhynchites rutilus septentrionalis]
MSTRWYPIYQRGNPQLRVFLPNFWLKLVRPEHEQPPNVVQFACSMEMTKYDVKNYLEKIYNVPVVEVRTRIAMGKTKRDLVHGYITKNEDTKMAYVTLPKDMKFEFPNMFQDEAKKKEEDDKKSLEETKKNYKKFLDKNKHRPGTPGWFTI